MRTKSSVLWHPLVVYTTFTAGYAGARWAFKHVEFSAPFGLAVALVPAAALVYLVLAHRQWIDTEDELEQRIQREGWVFALDTILVAVFLHYFLQKAGFDPRLEYIDVVVGGSIVGHLLGTFIAGRRYGVSPLSPP